MNERSRRPTLAPEDDPSIPVLTERMTLPVPAGARPVAPAAGTDAVIDGMVFPKEIPSRRPEPAAASEAAPRPAPHAFDLRPSPAGVAATAAKPVAAASIAPAAARAAAPASPLPTAATPATPTAPSAAIGMRVPAPPVAGPDTLAIRDAVLDDLSARLPREIEGLMRKQLAGSIEAAVQAASTDLAARIRNAAAQSLQTLVEQAVKAEIARLRLPPQK